MNVVLMSVFVTVNSLYDSDTVILTMYDIKKIISLKLKLNRFYYMLCNGKVADV